jgi:hypothetical protein
MEGIKKIFNKVDKSMPNKVSSFSKNSKWSKEKKIQAIKFIQNQ